MYSTEEVKNAWQLAKSQGIGYFGAVGNNPKTIKSDNKTAYSTYICYMAPSDLAGPKYNVCASASDGCKAACLNKSGRGFCTPVQEARIRRTKFWFEHRDEFKTCMWDEIQKHVKKCEKYGAKAAARFNGTSDILVEKQWPEIFTEFPSVQFYDYTKHYKRMLSDWDIPSNYHLTFSRSESNDDKVAQIIKNNKSANIAVVFNKVPDSWMKRKVIDGDDHDMRALDPKGVIVGLKAKGKAPKDDSGFVIHLKK